jgi:OPA family glycerol-3-phosphate transporter-like MFS transporter 1/2
LPSDNAYLFAYAVGMFISGPLAERMNLKLCLGVGMICSGAACALLGLAYFLVSSMIRGALNG